jgi:hypothetical protein
VTSAARFEEQVLGPSEDIANCVNVSADSTFVTIETDPYEGSAHMSFETAARLIPVLAKAVAYAKEADAQRDRPAEIEEARKRLEQRMLEGKAK